MGIKSLFAPNIERMKAAGDVKGLIRALSFKNDRAIRQTAARALGEIGASEAVGPLLQSFFSPVSSSDPVEERIQALARIGIPAIGALLSLNSEASVAGLSGMGEKIIPEIQASLDNPSYSVRICAAKVLKVIGGPDSVPALLKRLRNDDCQIHFLIEDALSRIAESCHDMIPPIVVLLRDQSKDVRRHAAGILSRLYWQGSIDEKIAFYLALERWEELASYGAPTVPAIIEFIRGNPPSLRGDWEKLIHALRQIGPPAFGPLEALAQESSSTLRRFAVEALGELGDQRAIPRLILALGSGESGISNAAEEALAKIGAPATPALIEQLRSGSKSGESVHRLLRKIGASAMEPLSREFMARDRRGREALIDTLDELGWNPTNLEERRARLVIKRDWEGLKGMGREAVPYLIDSILELEDCGKDSPSKAVDVLLEIVDQESACLLVKLLEANSWKVREGILRYLGKAGQKKTAEAVIDFLLLKGGLWINPDEGWVDQMKFLLGGYARLVLAAASAVVQRTGQVTHSTDPDGKHSHGTYTYEVGKGSTEAIVGLCRINSPVSSNILHRISQRKDVEVVAGWGCFGDYRGTFSLEDQRRIAISELERRGNPPYDPAAYLVPFAWDL